MKIAAWNLLLLILAFGVWAITAEVMADYEYENSIGSYWSLSEKASSLSVKADYLNKFVAAVDGAHLEGYDAIWLKTPDNSVEQNLLALHSLQARMNEIRGMDVSSFAYQQAISQITAQEQGEATKMLSVIEGRWYLEHHVMLWGWIDVVKWLAIILLGPVCFILFAVAYNWG